MRLPWRDGHPPFPDYKDMCRAQMHKAFEKLQKTGMVEQYSKLFQAWKAEGFIEEVSCSNQPSHFLPHRPVIKESKTTPIRPVFNASYKTGKNPSLNECLHKGPNVIQRIPEKLHRFREKRKPFTSDIRKAFQMIGVHQSDRDMLKFLWKSKDGREITFRHARVIFGANCSPFILGAVLEHFLTGVEGEKRIVAEKLLESLYVDNCVSSLDSESEYENFKSTSIQLLKQIQMDLREWCTTGEDIEEDEKVVSVLGMKWDREADELFLKLSDIKQPEMVSKKEVLSYVQKIFDVLGFVSPAILPMKILLQRAWINKEPGAFTSSVTPGRWLMEQLSF